MAQKNTPEVKKEQKVQTKYDRKMEARKLKAEQEKKEEKRFKVISTLAGIAVVAGIIIAIVASVMTKQQVLTGTYIKMGEEPISKLEFDYYYNMTTNSYLNSYASILPYMGLDTTADYGTQIYDPETGMTWQDMFEEMTVEQLKQTVTLVADANANGFTYDVETEYAANLESMKEAAETSGVTIGEYYKSLYGDYATVENIAPFLKEGILASAYYNHLLEENVGNEEEIATYYAEHKQDYDKVDYRSFAIADEIAEDATEEQIAAAMEEMKAKAETFMQSRVDGADFDTLCAELAPEEQKANYEDAETEKCLNEGVYSTGVPAAVRDWVYDDARAEGDIEVIEDTTNNRYYVVEFVQKYFDEADNANIGNAISSERVTEYVTGLMENYQVVDENGELSYLTLNVAE